MPTQFQPERLDVQAWAQALGQLSGCDLLSRFERLTQATQPVKEAREIRWSARGELRRGNVGPAQPWIFLQVQASLPLVCQRCLETLDVPLEFERAFRFVGSEAQAASEDETAQEDVLVLSREFDLRHLIEDELLLTLPLAPRHRICPQEVNLQTEDENFKAAAPAHPFESLSKLKNPKSANRSRRP